MDGQGRVWAPLPPDEAAKAGPSAQRIAATLQRWNRAQTPVRALIEQLWEAIDQHDDWQPLADWLAVTREQPSVRAS